MQLTCMLSIRHSMSSCVTICPLLVAMSLSVTWPCSLFQKRRQGGGVLLLTSILSVVVVHHYPVVFVSDHPLLVATLPMAAWPLLVMWTKGRGRWHSPEFMWTVTTTCIVTVWTMWHVRWRATSSSSRQNGVPVVIAVCPPCTVCLAGDMVLPHCSVVGVVERSWDVVMLVVVETKGRWLMMVVEKERICLFMMCMWAFGKRRSCGSV